MLPRRSWVLIAIGMMATMLSCDSVEKPNAEPWHRVQLRGFSFDAPQSLQRDWNYRGIDSYVGVFRSPGMFLDFDYGMYSG